MNFQEQLKLLEQNTIISNYFQDKNILDFINTYMQVDILLNTSKNIEPHYIQQQLSHIQQNISYIHHHITNELKQQLQYINNTDLKHIIIELQNNKDNNLKQTLDNFHDKLILLNSQNLNEFDRKHLNIIQHIQNTFNTSLDSHNISHKIHSIDNTLHNLHNIFTNNSSKKGELTENILLHNLIKAFPSSNVLNTSHIPNSGDIIIQKDNKPTILIDSKNFQNNVPKTDLEKFYRDCELNNCSGILCNLNNGISNKEHFQIDIQDSRIYIYISNHQFDNTLFQLAVNIIYHIHDIIKHNKTNIIEIDKQLFHRIKLEFNFFNQTLKQHLNIIKQNINSIEQLTMTQLEQFFKRSNFNELKPFSCSHCGTGYKTTKTLKKHMMDKHNVKLNLNTHTDIYSDIQHDEDYETSTHTSTEENNIRTF